MATIPRFLVAVQDELGNARTPWPVEDLSNAQLARLLDGIVDELVRRDVWAGPRPSAILTAPAISESELRALDGNR